MNSVSREIVVVWLLIFLLLAGSFFGLFRIRQETETLRTQMNTGAVGADIDARLDSLENRVARVEQGNSPLTERMSAFGRTHRQR